MAKYRIRKLVKGTYVVDEKFYHVLKIPLIEWYVSVPIWYWEPKNSSFDTLDKAEDFILSLAKNRNAMATLHNETRHYSAKGERVIDSYL